MKLFLIWILVLNASNGEIVASIAEDNVLMTAQECNQKILGRTSIEENGFFRVYLCHNPRMTLKT